MSRLFCLLHFSMFPFLLCFVLSLVVQFSRTVFATALLRQLDHYITYITQCQAFFWIFFKFFSICLFYTKHRHFFLFFLLHFSQLNIYNRAYLRYYFKKTREPSSFTVRLSINYFLLNIKQKFCISRYRPTFFGRNFFKFIRNFQSFSIIWLPPSHWQNEQTL